MSQWLLEAHITTGIRVSSSIDLPSLPEQWRVAAAQALPAMAREIATQIRTEIREYQHDPTGEVWVETQRAVHEALRMFQRTLDSGGQIRPEAGETFRRLGRLEARSGRSHDTLQAAYRIASGVAMRHLLDLERTINAPRDVMRRTTGAVFAFIDHLAALSAEGYASAARAVDTAHDRAVLLDLLLRTIAPPAEVIANQAAKVGWQPQERCVAVELIGRTMLDDAELEALAHELFGSQALAGWRSGRALVLVPGEVDAQALRRLLAPRNDGLLVSIGPCVPIREAAGSARLALRASMMPAMRADDGVIVTEQNLLTLVEDLSSDVTRALVHRRCGPLLALTPAKRVKYGRLLSALLEFGSIHGDAPGVLDKPRQTLRYQVAQLEAMFGDDLTDREARLELILALRAALPGWCREATARSPRPMRPAP